MKLHPLRYIINKTVFSTDPKKLSSGHAVLGLGELILWNQEHPASFFYYAGAINFLSMNLAIKLDFICVMMQYMAVHY